MISQVIKHIIGHSSLRSQDGNKERIIVYNKSHGFLIYKENVYYILILDVSFFYFCCFVTCSGKVLLCNPGWPWNHHPPASDSKIRLTIFKGKKKKVNNSPWEYTQYMRHISHAVRARLLKFNCSNRIEASLYRKESLIEV